MLEEIQGERSAEFEPENRFSPRAQPRDVPAGQARGETERGPAHLDSTPLGPGGQIDGGGVMREGNDSPTIISDDDTSFSTWKAPVRGVVGLVI